MDYCTTMALAHIFKFVPQEYLYAAPDVYTSGADLESIIRRYALYGA